MSRFATNAINRIVARIDEGLTGRPAACVLAVAFFLIVIGDTWL